MAMYFAYIGLKVPFNNTTFVIDERCIENGLPVKFQDDIWYLLSTLPSFFYLYGNEFGKMIVVYESLRNNSLVIADFHIVDVVLNERLNLFEECDCEFDLNDNDICRLHSQGICVAPKEDTRLACFTVFRPFVV